LRCGRGSAPDAPGSAEARGVSSRQVTVDGEVGADGDFRPSRVRSSGVASLRGGFGGSGSERRGFFEGVDGAARPSQRPGRLEAGVVTGVGAAAAEAGLGR